MAGKPEKPEESECCGSGCKPCIFDVYQEQLKKWESKRGNFPESKALNQIKYLPFLITNIENLGEFIKIIQFQAVKLKKENLNLVHIKNAIVKVDYEIFEEFLNIKSGEYLIMKGLFKTETISRSYTPILNKDNFEKGKFKIVISFQVNGKMSAFFREINVNDIVFWRGPYKELTHNLNSFKHLLLFGGGTGIVPLYNIAKTVVEDEESETWVNVFASFKTTENIILRNEFRILKDFWNFKMSIFITNQKELAFKTNYNEIILFKRIDECVIEEEVKKCGMNEVFVIVCGPEGFNHFVKDCFYKLGFSDNNLFIFW